MNIFSFLILLLIAFITGTIGANLAGRRKPGCLASIVLGFIGALIGTFIARQLDLPFLFSIRFGSHTFPIVWAILGSALFVAFLTLISRGGK